jgi:hypothetical protein
LILLTAECSRIREVLVQTRSSMDEFELQFSVQHTQLSN